MELRFLGQGFEEVSDNSVGKQLMKYLSEKDYHTFTAFSAFTSVAAIEGLQNLITNAPSNYSSFNFILGINQRGTSKEALEAVLKLQVNSFIFYHNPNLIFHPKIYLFEGNNNSKVIIGSSNLTNNGLFANIESSVLVTIQHGNSNDVAFLNEIKTYYKGIFDRSDPNLKPITQQLIEKLVDNGTIPTEEERKAEFLKNKTKSDKKTKSNIFPSRKSPSIPKEFKRTTSSIVTSKVALSSYTNKTYLYTEASYHFPQGVHIGHILYALKTIKDKSIFGSHLDDKYIRLRGGLDSGDLGGFQRKAKYLLVALMEMEIIEDNRNLSDQSKFKIVLTNKGKTITKMLSPLLDVANLKFKHKSSVIPSWEMVANKNHYISLLKVLINSSSEYLLFWQNLISFPAVIIMHKLLKSSQDKKIFKTDFIYNNFYSFNPTQSFCKTLNIKPGTAENAKHRCPFLLDLLEIGGILEQERRYITLTN
ncbi:MAG: hypothetical protein GQ574_25715 [Crocinitomix sp.]|nr:hypothetical protein [Crocinitomix sp.]